MKKTSRYGRRTPGIHRIGVSVTPATVWTSGEEKEVCSIKKHRFTYAFLNFATFIRVNVHMLLLLQRYQKDRKHIVAHKTAQQRTLIFCVWFSIHHSEHLSNQSCKSWSLYVKRFWGHLYSKVDFTLGRYEPKWDSSDNFHFRHQT
jgi:hypothetical protein